MSFTLYCAAQRGDTRNTLYPRRRVITSFPDLQTAARFDHVAAEFEGSRRLTALDWRIASFWMWTTTTARSCSRSRSPRTSPAWRT